MPSCLAPNPHRTLTWRRKAVFALVLVVALFVVVEVAWRTAFGWQWTWLDCHRADPVLGWRLREGWSGRWDWTAGDSHINAQGIRDDRPVERKLPGERRLLVLGDSITFGARVRTEETYCRKLEEFLAAEGAPWRVLNGGVTGYDAAQEADWLETVGLSLEPDALAVGFCWNDVFASDRGEWAQRYGANRATEWLNRHSLTFFQFQRGIHRLQARLPGCIGPEPAGLTCAERVAAGWPNVERAYRQIAARAAARNMPVFLVLFPTRFDADRLPIQDGLRDRLNRCAAEQGWVVIDLLEVFRADPGQLYLPGDNLHPTPEGHRRAGQAIARELRGRLGR